MVSRHSVRAKARALVWMRGLTPRCLRGIECLPDVAIPFDDLAVGAATTIRVGNGIGQPLERSERDGVADHGLSLLVGVRQRRRAPRLQDGRTQRRQSSVPCSRMELGRSARAAGLDRHHIAVVTAEPIALSG